MSAEISRYKYRQAKGVKTLMAGGLGPYEQSKLSRVAAVEPNLNKTYKGDSFLVRFRSWSLFQKDRGNHYCLLMMPSNRR